MRVKYGIIYGLLAVMGVAVGLKLPDMVFDSMDQKSMDQPMLYKTSAVQFEQEMDTTLSDYLRLASRNIPWQMLDPESARSSPETVYKAAVEALRLFIRYQQASGVPEAFVQRQQLLLEKADVRENAYNGYDASDEFHDEYPLLAIATVPDHGSDEAGPGDPVDDQGDGKRMAVIFWWCTLRDEDNNRIVMAVDDATGKALSISYFAQNAEPLEEDELYEISRLLPNALSGFFADYYALDVSHMRYEPYTGQGTGGNTSEPALTETSEPMVTETSEPAQIEDPDNMAIAEMDDGDAVDGGRGPDGGRHTDDGSGLDGGNGPGTGVDGRGNGGTTIAGSAQRGLDSYIAVGTDAGDLEAALAMDSTGQMIFYLTCMDAGGDALRIPIMLKPTGFSMNAAL